jgi:hypothetical protein
MGAAATAVGSGVNSFPLITPTRPSGPPRAGEPGSGGSALTSVALAFIYQRRQ